MFITHYTNLVHLSVSSNVLFRFCTDLNKLSKTYQKHGFIIFKKEMMMYNFLSRTLTTG